MARRYLKNRYMRNLNIAMEKLGVTSYDISKKLQCPWEISTAWTIGAYIPSLKYQEQIAKLFKMKGKDFLKPTFIFRIKLNIIYAKYKKKPDKNRSNNGYRKPSYRKTEKTIRRKH